jgi:hypothetical protein
MLQRSRILHVMLLLILVSGSFMMVEGQQRRRQRFRQARTSPATLECRTFCSNEKLRTPIAELIWKSSEAQLSGERIEATVYKDGFSNGRYVALATVRGGRSLQMQKSRQSQELLPALKGLVVIDTISLPERPGMMAVRMEGLEPGLNYFWRVVSINNGRLIGSGVTRCKAPACPADLQPNQKP